MRRGTNVRLLLLILLSPLSGPGAAAVSPKVKRGDKEPPPAAGKKAAARASRGAARAAAEEAAPPSPPITVVYPPEGWTMPLGPGEMVYGSVGRPKAGFRINGLTVKPHPLGGYLTYLPVSPGTFTFHCELELPYGTTAYDRTIYVVPPPSALPPGMAEIDPDSLVPAEDVELRPGDWLTVRMRATPGLQAEFQVPGIKRRFPLPELDPALGLYEGAAQFQPGDSAEPAAVQFLAKGFLGPRATASSRGKVSVLGSPPSVAVVKAGGNLKTGPEGDYLLFPTQGTKLLIVGRRGAETEARLSPDRVGWINTASLETLPAGTPPPRALLGTIQTTAAADSTVVRLGLSDTVPFLLEPSPDLTRLTVRLFYTVDHTNWIVYDSEDYFVGHIGWVQDETDSVSVAVHLAAGRRLWGYHAEWSNGSLKLELRHPPRFAAKGPAIRDRTIIVDPGHTPGVPGAEGPRGTLEKDVNLAIAKELAALLREAGAKPVLTRSGDEEVGLTDRARLAWEKRGEVFVSIHNNNLPDGANPFKAPHGYSVFYYQPHSLELARAVHRAYRAQVPLPDESLRYGNLLVARITEMPAVLVESAYMNFPEQEALLSAPAFRRKLARAVFTGLSDWLQEERARQLKAPMIARLPRPKPPGAAEPGAAKRARAKPKGAAPAAAARKAKGRKGGKAGSET